MVAYWIEKRPLRIILGLVVAAAAVWSAGSAQAGVVTYPNVVLNNVELTNIQESNTLAGNVALYRAPTATADGNGITFNASQNPFTVNAANGSSNSLSGTLSFTVTFLPLDPPTSSSPVVTLSEAGTFAGVGNATATVVPTLVLNTLADSLITSVGGTITPLDPFSGGADNTQQAFIWTGAATAGDPGQVTGYNVVLTNVLTATSLAQGASAQIDKKTVGISFCSDCTGATPQPASLGILGLGGLALLIRKRRR